jgi:hypothetical protein
MQSPLLGFNNNVRHKGKLFHIQTEDSGIRYPHVITHLFMDGGRILKTVKTSYAEHVKSERLAEVVRGLMKEQHKAMFIALRDGQFDRVIEGDEGSKSGERPTAGRSATGMQRILETDQLSVSAPPVSTLPASTSQGPEAPTIAELPGRSPEPSVTPTGRVGRREAPDLFGATSEGVSVVSDVAPEPSNAPLPNRQSSGRYAASRPAAIFSSNRPAQAGGSLFGDELINEKSLDEVILSYLSDDLDEADKDKSK